jgi:hypothetical protein
MRKIMRSQQSCKNEVTYPSHLVDLWKEVSMRSFRALTIYAARRAWSLEGQDMIVDLSTAPVVMPHIRRPDHAGGVRSPGALHASVARCVFVIWLALWGFLFLWFTSQGVNSKVQLVTGDLHGSRPIPLVLHLTDYRCLESSLWNLTCGSCEKLQDRSSTTLILIV